MTRFKNSQICSTRTRSSALVGGSLNAAILSYFVPLR